MPVTVYVTGYGRHMPDQLLALAECLDAHPVDIRYWNKGSKARPEWGEENLRKVFGDVEYIHIKELGNAAFKDQAIRIADPEAGVYRVKMLLKSHLHAFGANLLLFCACGKPEGCHRQQVRALLEEYNTEVEEADWNLLPPEMTERLVSIVLPDFQYKEGSFAQQLQALEKRAKESLFFPKKDQIALDNMRSSLYTCAWRIKIALRTIYGPATWGMITEYLDEFRIDRHVASSALIILIQTGEVFEDIDYLADTQIYQYRLAWQGRRYLSEKRKDNQNGKTNGNRGSTAKGAGKKPGSSRSSRTGKRVGLVYDDNNTEGELTGHLFTEED